MATYKVELIYIEANAKNSTNAKLVREPIIVPIHMQKFEVMNLPNLDEAIKLATYLLYKGNVIAVNECYNLLGNAFDINKPIMNFNDSVYGLKICYSIEKIANKMDLEII